MENHHLVGGWPTPLKNMSSSDGIIIPTIGKNIRCSKPPTRSPCFWWWKKTPEGLYRFRNPAANFAQSLDALGIAIGLGHVLVQGSSRHNRQATKRRSSPTIMYGFRARAKRAHAIFHSLELIIRKTICSYLSLNCPYFFTMFHYVSLFATIAHYFALCLSTFILLYFSLILTIFHYFFIILKIVENSMGSFCPGSKAIHETKSVIQWDWTHGLSYWFHGS